MDCPTCGPGTIVADVTRFADRGTRWLCTVCGVEWVEPY